MKMKEVTFYETDQDDLIIIDFNDKRYGKLEFDKTQGVWVLWPNDINDGISYFEDINETETTIIYEIKNYE